VTLEKNGDIYKLQLDLARIPDNTYDAIIVMKTSETAEEVMQRFYFTVKN